jgi:hypothetical protein
MLETNHATFAPLDRLGSRIPVGPVLNHGVQTTDVEGCHTLWKGQIHSHLQRHTELLHRDIWIRRNYGTGTKLYALALEIVTDAALLGAQTLLKRL